LDPQVYPERVLVPDLVLGQRTHYGGDKGLQLAEKSSVSERDANSPIASEHCSAFVGFDKEFTTTSISSHSAEHKHIQA